MEAQLFITNKCNLGCGGCELWKKTRLIKELRPEQLKSWISKLKESGINGIRFIGGEPFAYGNGTTDFLDILGHAVNLRKDGSDFRTFVCSNSMMSERQYEGMLERAPYGYVASVNKINNINPEVDMDIKSKHGFDMLKRLRDTGKIEKLIGNMVISRDNLGSVAETIRTLDGEGLSANICAYVHGNHGKPAVRNADGTKQEFNWGFRTNGFTPNMFTEEDRRELQQVAEELQKMKQAGVRLTTADSYLENLAHLAINGDYLCKARPTHLDIDPGGSLNFCNEIKGSTAEKYSILDLNAGRLQEFLDAREKEYNEEIDCGGHCAWSVYANTANGAKAGTYFDSTERAY